jgi:hypothetical protein
MFYWGGGVSRRDNEYSSDPCCVDDGMTLIWPRLFDGTVLLVRLLPILPEGNIGRHCPPWCAGKASGCHAGISYSGWDSLPLNCLGNFPKECAYVKADALTSAALSN